MIISLQLRTGLFCSQAIEVTVLNKKGNDENQNGQSTQVRKGHLHFLSSRSKTRWEEDECVAIKS
jgi:hypothetical protein